MGKQERFVGKVLTAEAWQLQLEKRTDSWHLTSTLKQTMHARMWPENILVSKIIELVSKNFNSSEL